MEDSAMDTTSPGTDDPLTAADTNRRIPVADHHARRYMDPFAHLAHRMVESSAGMDHARRLAEWLPTAMNRQAAVNTNVSVEELYPVDARRFGEQFPGVTAASPAASAALAAKDRRFVDQAAAFQRQFRQPQDQQQALLASTNPRFTEQLHQASTVNSTRFNESQADTEQEKLGDKVERAHSVDSGKTTLETESKETSSNTPGVPEVKPQVPAAAPPSGGNNDNSQQQNTIESQNYSLDFKSGTFIKNTEPEEPPTPQPPSPAKAPQTEQDVDNPFTPKVEDVGEEDQVYPKLEEPLCLLDTKVEEPSGDSEERESRARINYKESSEDEEMPLSIRRTSKKQRKLKNDVTKIESEDYDESSLQVDAFLALSQEETSILRTGQKEKYNNLNKSTHLNSILVTTLQDLQTMKERYEDGILAFNNFYNYITTGSSSENCHTPEQLEELESGLAAMFEGLKKHVALQDFIMCSYEGKTYNPPTLEVISSKPGRKLRKGTKLKQNKKRSKGTLDLDVTINDTENKVDNEDVDVKEEKNEENIDDIEEKAEGVELTDPVEHDIHDIDDGSNDQTEFDDISIPVTVKIENGEEESDFDYRPDKKVPKEKKECKVRKERKLKKTKLKLKPKSKTEVKVKVKVKKENGSTELEEGEIKDPPKRPIPPPLPFDPPKPLDSYEYKGPLGRGQRREEMVKRETGEIHYCPYCPKAFKIKRGLDGHLRIHRATQPLECDVCGETFKKLRLLEDHKRIHSDETPYECELCNKKFRTKRSINDHRRTHTDERRFKCDQCFMAFRQLGHLNVHLKIHSGEKPYQCEDCDKAFVTKTSLRYHKMVHTGEKPLTCDECGQGFTHRGQLKNHMMHHTGERPFQCDQCSKGFIRKMELVHHMRVHTGERPYKCDVCFNAFTHKHILENHYRIHTGAKPYECDICGHKSRQRGDSLKHKAKMHKDHVAQPTQPQNSNSNSNS